MSSPRSCRRPTLGPQLLLKKNTFQGLVVPVVPSHEPPDIAAIASDALAKQPRWRKFQAFPRASRVRVLTTNGSNASASEAKLVEESEDNSLIGVGERLLYLLQRWQVTNVVVVVAHRDDSLSARLLGGVELYKLATEAAKLALEQHYLDSVAEANKIAAEVALEQQEKLHQVVPAKCVMSSETVPTWPKHHQPTSDGGGRKGVKQGRINHFRYRAADRDKDKNQEVESVERVSIETIAKSTSGGGLEWLGISREEWRKLRGIRVPVKELHYLFMCLVVLLEPPIEQRDGRKTKPTPKQQEQFVPSDFSWAHCRQVLHKSSEWSHRLRIVRGSTLAPSQAAALRAIFEEPTFTESAFVRIAGGAGTKIFAWLQKLLDEYDEKDLGMLRIDMPSEAALQPPTSLISAHEDDEKFQQQEDQKAEKHDQTAEQGSPELRALRSVSKGPKSPARKQLKIVDPGRLFGRHHATQ